METEKNKGESSFYNKNCDSIATISKIIIAVFVLNIVLLSYSAYHTKKDVFNKVCSIAYYAIITYITYYFAQPPKCSLIGSLIYHPVLILFAMFYVLSLAVSSIYISYSVIKGE